LKKKIFYILPPPFESNPRECKISGFHDGDDEEEEEEEEEERSG
jgi:hypothetical protein